MRRPVTLGLLVAGFWSNAITSALLFLIWVWHQS